MNVNYGALSLKSNCAISRSQNEQIVNKNTSSYSMGLFAQVPVNHIRQTQKEIFRGEQIKPACLKEKFTPGKMLFAKYYESKWEYQSYLRSGVDKTTYVLEFSKYIFENYLSKFFVCKNKNITRTPTKRKKSNF